MPETLPPPCGECAPYGGRCKIVEAFSPALGYVASRVAKCGCARGVELARLAATRNQGPMPPVLTKPQAEVVIEMLAVLPYFPGEEGARMVIGMEICAMCRSVEDAKWLVGRMIRLHGDQWPGLQELRRVYCAGRRPLDGVEAIGISERYADGIPSEQPEEAARPLLPPGRAISADFQLDAAARELAAPKRLPGPAEQFPIAVTPPKIAVRPEMKHFKPITQADVDRAAEKLREARIDAPARKEAGFE